MIAFHLFLKIDAIICSMKLQQRIDGDKKHTKTYEA